MCALANQSDHGHPLAQLADVVARLGRRIGVVATSLVVKVMSESARLK